MGQTALLPSEGRRNEDSFALKNPMALGTKGQHAASRPPKPLCPVRIYGSSTGRAPIHVRRMTMLVTVQNNT